MMTKLTLVYAILLLGGGTAGATWGYLRAFLEADFLGNIFFSVGLCLGVSLLVLSFRAAWEETRRRQLKTAFNQYLSPEMVRRIDMSGSGPSLGGQTIPVSVMFMDIRGFTSLSEALSDDPQHLTKIINTIMERTTTIVLEHGGTLDKYIGDALMAFWNAPMPQEDHAARASPPPAQSRLPCLTSMKRLRQCWVTAGQVTTSVLGSASPPARLLSAISARASGSIIPVSAIPLILPHGLTIQQKHRAGDNTFCRHSRRR